MTLNIQHNVCLQDHNTMSVPARATHFVSVANVSEARQSLEYARAHSLEILVLGKGSNTIFRDDFQGLVILNKILCKKLISESSDSSIVTAGAGENWHDFVAYTLENKWFGLQNLGLIPGLVGAAPIQNIGAYGAEVKDNVLSVDYLDITSGELHCLSNADCRFAYRDSIFKTDLADSTLITGVTFNLSKVPEVDLSYPALSAMFSVDVKPTPIQVFDAVCRLRRLKLPMPEDIPNTGSFFKNPVIDAQQHRRIKVDHPDLVSFAVADQFKLAAAWLIENAGWKNHDFEGVRVHSKQALVIINPNKCKGEAVLRYASQIQEDIYAKFGVSLEIEPRIYG